MPARHLVDLAATATRLADAPYLWEPLVDYDPVSRFYARLALTPEHEAWLLTWVPGQGTDWHDHGGSAGAFVVVRGSLTEEHARLQDDGSARVAETRSLGTGALRPFGTRHIHRVTNTGLEPAVSIHVYAPALTRMNGYVREGDRLELVESRLAGVAW
ncbi:cysteine dioxygenase [Microlunatus flavus]|uniref:Mannose-6-phosphate isomerase, cupin superfamily n=1 Tax=Microlunatus flavus TaxID=1036181 RepID=A0A1H8Z4W5_9ACTN|nr:cysteine dioxygenase family protein [Microlunatus flavus]SEP59297.1 Mannose-6-phosphate isomerase, cupin superfamily [Microlunatus flavus]